MNALCSHNLENFYNSFISRSFDQQDVANFFYNFRDYSENESTIREIGDFLAHPKNKDQGKIIKSIKHIMPQFEMLLRKRRRSKKEGTKIVTFNSIGTNEQLLKELNALFSNANLQTTEIQIDDLPFRDFIFCCIFLLSTFQVKYKNNILPLKVIYSHNLTLQTKAESSEINNYFINLPVLQLNNVWVKCPSTIAPVQHVLTNHIARRFQQGYLAAISYENDKKHTVYDSNSFSKGELWPLYEYKNDS